ncbi:hypothetical protein KOW79_012601 [Hemibagrus wyckioides]|uniref:Uncharacterized protein n=1 Tax=Hemibagrus wyckioides TaxID=337641 RepID=A0A9D3NP76_9TELE|nr:hypothetical protein KOW79_012601 [Hemibagrus wyckioides]
MVFSDTSPSTHVSKAQAIGSLISEAQLFTRARGGISPWLPLRNETQAWLRAGDDQSERRSPCRRRLLWRRLSDAHGATSAQFFLLVSGDSSGDLTDKGEHV